jgi:hypothetical protein
LAIGGKIAPSPSSPFSRSSTKATAASIARARSFFGNSGSIARHGVESAKQQEPAPALMRRLGGHADGTRILQEQLVSPDTFGIPGARL